jgi:hypothetical protein
MSASAGGVVDGARVRESTPRGAHAPRRKSAPSWSARARVGAVADEFHAQVSPSSRTARLPAYGVMPRIRVVLYVPGPAQGAGAVDNRPVSVDLDASDSAGYASEVDNLVLAAEFLEVGEVEAEVGDVR